MRVAIVTGGADTVSQVESYLPGNFEVVEKYVKPIHGADQNFWITLIVGEDKAGWTLEDYVIPRLASGLIGAEVIA